MRRPVVVLVAFLLLAVVPPAYWWATRPSASQGPPVASLGLPGSTAENSTPQSSTTAEPMTVPPPTGVPSYDSSPSLQAVPGPGPDVAAPARLRIAAVGVDAQVDPVGVDANAAMVVPAQASRVGWYRFGPAPGSGAGAAVIAGHVDSHDLGAGALFRLREISVGDLVTVTTTGGAGLTYRVAAKETIVKRRLPTERLFARDGAPRLVLITCGGPFIPALSSYRDNLVVVALPVDRAPRVVWGAG